MLRASPRQLTPQATDTVEPLDRFAIFRLGVMLRYVASRRRRLGIEPGSVIDVRSLP